MKGKIKAPPIITIFALTVITLVFWIGFEVYRAFTKTTPPEIKPQILIPLSPALDLETLNRLQNRVLVSDSEISDEIVVIPVQTASPSGIVEEQEIATNSGEIAQ